MVINNLIVYYIIVRFDKVVRVWLKVVIRLNFNFWLCWYKYGVLMGLFRVKMWECGDAKVKEW